MTVHPCTGDVGRGPGGVRIVDSLREAVVYETLIPKTRGPRFPFCCIHSKPARPLDNEGV